jgi:hypothetical protein
MYLILLSRFFSKRQGIWDIKIFWIDACTIPIKNLDPLFDFIEENGMCFLRGKKMKWTKFNLAYKFLYPSLDTKKANFEVITQVIGFNTKNPLASKALDMWIESAENKVPFLMSDQVPLGFIIYNLNLDNCKIPSKWFIETPWDTGVFQKHLLKSNVLLYHQYDFVNSEYKKSCDNFIDALRP